MKGNSSNDTILSPYLNRIASGGKVLKPRWFGSVGFSAAADTATLNALAADLDPGMTADLRGYPFDIGGSVIFPSNNIVIDMAGATITQKSNIASTFIFTGDDIAVFGNRTGRFIGRGGAAGEFNGASTNYNGAAAINVDNCDRFWIDGIRCHDHAGGDIVGFDPVLGVISNCWLQGIGQGFINPGA